MSAPAAQLPLDVRLDVHTPEHVAFTYRPAGPLVRFWAFVIDTAVVGLLIFAIFIIFVIISTLTGRVDLGAGILLLLIFIVWWGYGTALEYLWRGRTIGKAILRLRVISVDGTPVTFTACLVRNLVRYGDLLPVPIAGPFWVPAGAVLCLGTMSLTTGFRRLGDLAAGTLVISTVESRPRLIKPIKDKDVIAYADELPGNIVRRLDGRTVRAVTNYMTRRRLLSARRANAIARHLAEAMERAYGIEPAPSPDIALCAVYLCLYRLRSGDDEQDADAGPRPRQRRSQAAESGYEVAHAVLAGRREDWRKLERLLDENRKLDGHNAYEFSRLYRATCADLALADAYHLAPGLGSFLHQLVARAHLSLYRNLAQGSRGIYHMIAYEIPLRCYRDRATSIGIAAFYGTFALALVLGFANPELAHDYVGEDMLAGVQEMYADPPRDRDGAGAIGMTGFYVMNNVGIGLGSFASGIFFGIGALVSLIYNGLLFGFLFALMWMGPDPNRSHFFEFVAAHGPFELTGIALAGAAGFRLGWGVIASGGLPRLAGLAASAKQSVPILLAAAGLIALAAPIEGFVSPSSMPVAFKQLVSATCALLVVLYFVGLGMVRHHQAPPEQTGQLATLADDRQTRHSLDQAARASGGLFSTWFRRSDPEEDPGYQRDDPHGDHRDPA